MGAHQRQPDPRHPGRCDLRKGKVIGYPYGSIPRLLLFWITTEAVKSKTRRVELGHSLTAFMLELGLNPDNGGTGAKRSDARRLRDQMERLFQSRISFHEKVEQKDRRGHAWLNMEVAPKGILWWDIRNPHQDTLWGSWIELGADFFSAITSAPVPVDTRALKFLKRSPLALDLYASTAPKGCASPVPARASADSCRFMAR